MSERYRGRKPGRGRWWVCLPLWAAATAAVALALSTTASGYGL